MAPEHDGHPVMADVAEVDGETNLSAAPHVLLMRHILPAPQLFDTTRRRGSP
ncbi:MAG: hypothetical protein V3R77_01395 [Candidatus Binatia bacterium]